MDRASWELHTHFSASTFANPTDTRKTMTSHSIAPVTLVLGGARSGKSSYAERLASGQAASRIYLATAQAADGEMAERIHKHRARRGDSWHTVEEPVALVGALERECAADRIVLVDCLTLWLSNILLAEMDISSEVQSLVQSLAGLSGPVIFVTNEVGMGIVPENALARRFRDEAGRLNQEVAAAADAVVFVAAGLPLFLKQPAS